jgi:hypothetical protein
MKHLVAMATAGLLLSGAAAAAPQYGDRYGSGYGNDALIRCESQGGGTDRCEVEGGISDARLVRQLSKAACVEGRTWGRERGFLWVAGGCRGEFSVRRGGGGGWGDSGWGNNDRVFRCESQDNRYQQCASDSRGRARLVRQLSKSPCIEGRTWGSTRGGVWVDRGCRAEFASGRGNGWGNGGNWGDRPGYGDGYAQTVRCESIDGRSRECSADVRRGVRLSRQLSDTRCVEGQNWGWDRRGIWVTRGCRAEFEVR